MHPSNRTYRPKVRTREAAQYAGSSESKFEKFRVYGGGPPYMTIGSTVVYDLDDIDDWLATHRRISTSVGEAA